MKIMSKPLNKMTKDELIAEFLTALQGLSIRQFKGIYNKLSKIDDAYSELTGKSITHKDLDNYQEGTHD